MENNKTREELIKEIKALREQLTELKDYEEKYKSLINTSPDAVTVTDLEGRIIDVSQHSLELHGCKRPEDIIGRNAFELIAPEDQEKARKNLQKTLKKGTVRDAQYNMLKKDGSHFLGELNAALVRDAQGRPKAFIATVRDITLRKKAEEKIQTSLEEKDVLLQEIHHRVKNNMQIIYSLLNLQSRFIKDEKVIEMFRESRDRIRSMALIHEKLYKSKDLARINFAEYIQSLVVHLFHTYEINPRMIRVRTELEEVFLDVNTAIPCSLIINELVSNTLKHAFPAGKKGEIHIKLLSNKRGRTSLIVSDNGVGFDEDINFRNPGSLGLQLVNDLVKQIKGSVTLEKKEGTTFKITF